MVVDAPEKKKKMECRHKNGLGVLAESFKRVSEIKKTADALLAQPHEEGCCCTKHTGIKI